MNKSIGEKLAPILVEIEDTIWEFDAAEIGRPNYPIEAFRASIKIFMSVLMDKMWELQCNETLSFEDRCNMAQKAGEDLRKLVKIYTDIDTIELYNTINEN